MPEKLVLVGVIPEIVVIGPTEQVVWLSDAGNLRVEFDPNRCPFSSNVLQAPPARQLQSGAPRPGTKPGSYKYRLWLNDQLIGQAEVILREK
jgi:outer membrane usher protein FimD/PapC